MRKEGLVKSVTTLIKGLCTQGRAAAGVVSA